MSRSLKLENVTVQIGSNQVLNGISFALAQGEIGCLLGPSGCGKTTLLRVIAGLQDISGGEVLIGDTVVSRPSQTLSTEKRRIGMVFQDFALFPHLTVSSNIAFGLKNLSRAQQKNRIATLVELTGLQGLEKRYPHEISGGQQQRVALARALAPSPDVLLMDEPFSSLDRELRETLACEVRDILKAEGATAILVTHDPFEAFAMADQVGVINSGEILQWGDSYRLYHAPTHPFVARFIGHGDFLAGTLISPDRLQTPLGDIQLPQPLEGKFATLFVRPELLQVVEHGPIRAKVLQRRFRGAHYLYSIQLSDGAPLTVQSSLPLTPGDQCHIALNLTEPPIVFPGKICDIQMDMPGSLTPP
ncbi:MAG TPA: ABC transporter ATP-binding protein [Halothiobacillus sp.]|nr:ABC transporter ATP-binding protein [Halothiobacillus sp.]